MSLQQPGPGESFVTNLALVSKVVCEDVLAGELLLLRGVVVVVFGQVLQRVQDVLQLLDDELRHGEVEGVQEDEEVGEDLLDESPVHVAHSSRWCSRAAERTIPATAAAPRPVSSAGTVTSS